MGDIAQFELSDYARVEAEMAQVLVNSGDSSGHSPPRHLIKGEGHLLVQQVDYFDGLEG